MLVSLSSASVAVLPAVVSGDNPATPVAETIQIIKDKDLDISNYEPITDSKNVERFVNDYFADTPILANIARCESRYRQFNKAGNPLRGEENHYDVGVMQINELYHADEAAKLGLDIYSLEGNVAFAKHLYEKSGAKPWMSSSPCWAKFKESAIAKR